jgi:hypothetical protein
LISQLAALTALGIKAKDKTYVPPKVTSAKIKAKVQKPMECFWPRGRRLARAGPNAFKRQKGKRVPRYTFGPHRSYHFISERRDHVRIERRLRRSDRTASTRNFDELEILGDKTPARAPVWLV